MKYSSRLSDLGTETAFEVLAQVNELRARGKNIVALSIGEPACATAGNIKDAAKKALDEDMTHYGPSQGLLDFRKVIAEDMTRRRGIAYSADEVVVVPGGKPIIFYAMLAILEKGDEAIYPNPGYPIYESMISFAGAKAVPLRLREDKKFSFDVDELRSKITDKTRLIVVNSPHNPTGGVIPRDDLEVIANLAKEHDLWVLSDEIYNRIVYDAKFESIIQFPDMKERTIILDGHSKTYAMTGWRVGYGVMPKKMAGYMTKLMTNSNSCTATFTQIAGIEAIAGQQEYVEGMVEDFRSNKELIIDGLNAIPGIVCHKPAGAFYAYPNVTQVCKDKGFRDSRDVQQFLLYKGNVAVLGQQCFGPRLAEEKDEYIRLSYVSSAEDIKEALKRIAAALSNDALIREYLEEQKEELPA
jgi:aspartate/methionine/tyrosine aminotransferase